MNKVQTACDALAEGYEYFRDPPNLRPDLEMMFPALPSSGDKALYTNLWRATYTDFWQWQSRDLSKGQSPYNWFFARS